MLVIRLTRRGRKNQPFFRIIVADKKRSAKGGRAVEILGYLNPLTKRKSLSKERILHWISKGAQPSDTVHNLLISEQIITGKKRHVAKVKAREKKEASPTEAKEPTPSPAPATGEAPAQPSQAPPAQGPATPPAPAEPSPTAPKTP